MDFNEVEDLGFEELFPSVLNRTEVFERKVSSDDEEHWSSLHSHIDLLERTAILPVQLSQVVINEADLQMVEGLRAVFVQLLHSFLRHFGNSSSRITRISFISHNTTPPGGAGRPRVNIPLELLEDLRGVGFTWEQMAKMFRVSRWTVMRRVQFYRLQGLSRFSSITDEEIDGIIRAYTSNHGYTTGESYMRSHFRALGYYVPRKRIRAGINRVDPRNTTLRWGALVSRRVYAVPWPNSLWHLDGHHSLIRWGLVIHGCIDGYSRRIICLACGSNNLAETVLHLFETAIRRDGGLWPSRIRVDYGVENTAVCDAMVAVRGEGRGSFMAGSSHRNQRIERLWRDVFRCICHLYYYTFYALEQSGQLDVENPIHLFCLHYVFVPRINKALKEWMHSHNHHPLSTEHNWSPNQIWLNGMLNPCNPLAQGEVDDHLQERLQVLVKFLLKMSLMTRNIQYLIV